VLEAIGNEICFVDLLRGCRNVRADRLRKVGDAIRFI
jgi:hypothetical protein